MKDQYKKAGTKVFTRKNKNLQSDFLIRPPILKICGDVAEKSILDAGCGQGYLSIRLAKKGAIVQGIDLSPQMIEEANTSNLHPNITYVQGDVMNIGQIYQNQKFDIIIVSMVFPYFKKQQISSFIDRAGKMLNPGGKIIIANTHPSFGIIPFKSGWVTIDHDENGYFKNKKYKARLFNGDKQSFPVNAFHCSMSDLINPIISAGLIIKDFIEPKSNSCHRRHFTDLWGDEKNKPVYIIISAIKPDVL